MTVRQARGRTIGAAVEGLRRDSRVLTEELVADLDVTMAATFGAAQAMVPVELGSLRNSGRSGSDVRDRGETWIGWMSWGGESQPREVDYAVYAMAAGEGGEGDWLRESHVYEKVFDAVIRSNVARRLA